MKSIRVNLKSLLFQGNLFWVAFTLGALNRLALFLVSRRTTDDYIEPIQRWIETGNFPNALDCLECFQPPLFFSIIKSLTSVFNLSTRVELLITIQVVNLIIGISVLFVMLLIIQKFKFNSLLGFSLMLFASLNPELISVNVLGTNDNLGILLGLGISYFLINLNARKTNIYVLCIFIILGVATKGNHLVFLGISSLFILASIIKHNSYKSIKKIAPLFLLWFISLFAGGFVKKYNQYGDAFAIPREKQPLPSIFEKTSFNGRPGVESFASAFGTFHFKSLIEEPFNHYESVDYPTHRTSMFTQFYGQFSNYFFERHPNSWTPANEFPNQIARINYFVHLPLVLIFLFGLFLLIKESIISHSLESTKHLIILLSFVSFVIVFSSMYRDFTYMKLHYTFPALYSLIYTFSKGLSTVRYKNIVSGILLVVSLLYIIDSYLLVEVLYNLNS
ncbi:MAG: hypothetical protein HKP14_00710 [Bacteroidia bacterium]|nr:hypothetical protein [Bacteroidia bacterium]